MLLTDFSQIYIVEETPCTVRRQAENLAGSPGVANMWQTD